MTITPLTPTALDEIEALALKATPGPWLLTESGATVYALNAYGSNRFWASVEYGWDDRNTRVASDEASANAEHIAAVHPQAVLALIATVRAERQRADAAYEERNRCVALLARMAIALGYKAGTAHTVIEGWDTAWHGCIYIDLPVGQVSWHYHDNDAWIFDSFPPYDGAWDGHDTPEKYRRVHGTQLPNERATTAERSAQEACEAVEVLAAEFEELRKSIAPAIRNVADRALNHETVKKVRQP